MDDNELIFLWFFALMNYPFPSLSMGFMVPARVHRRFALLLNSDHYWSPQPFFSFDLHSNECEWDALSLRCSWHFLTSRVPHSHHHTIPCTVNSYSSAFVGSNSKDLLSAVLRAEVDLDEHIHPPFSENGAAAEEDPFSISNGKQQQQPPPGPTRLIIGDDGEENYPPPVAEEEEEDSDTDDAVHPRLLQRERERDRGRYISVTSTRSQPPPTMLRLRDGPGTPTRGRRAADAMLIRDMASPLARSFSQGRRPLSAVVGSTYSLAGSVGRGEGGASNDDVLAALKRLETTFMSSGAGAGAAAGGSGSNVEKQEEGKSQSQAAMLKELGERQTRIEALLLSLTREMRS